MTDICDPAVAVEFLKIDAFKAIYEAREEELEMLGESMMTNPEATTAAVEQLKADVEAGNWFMAGMDTAALIDVVVTQASEQLA